MTDDRPSAEELARWRRVAEEEGSQWDLRLLDAYEAALERIAVLEREQAVAARDGAA